MPVLAHVRGRAQGALGRGESGHEGLVAQVSGLEVLDQLVQPLSLDLRDGCATTATLTMPGPWARHAADHLTNADDLDVGIHLTLNAELESFRWAPLTHAPSLLDGDGGFPRTPEDLWDHADIDEVRRECRAQVEPVLMLGCVEASSLCVEAASSLCVEARRAYVELLRRGVEAGAQIVELV